MDGKNQNINGVQTGYRAAEPASIAGRVQQGASANPGAFSLDETSSANAAPTVSRSPEKKPNPLVGLAKRADVVLAILLILGSGGLFLSAYLDKGDENGADAAATSRFDPLRLPLSDFTTEEGVDFGTHKVSINGELEVNGDFVLTPSLQPSSAAAGQLYYDEASNVLAYYNGTEFVALGGGVTSLQGENGAVTLSGAGGITVANDGAGNITLTGPGGTGVTSLNGLAGGLTVADTSTAGSTITINDATTTSKGIASFNGTNFAVSGGAVNTVQNINTAATPTFAGVNTNTIQGGASLSLLSGGNVSVGTSNGVGTLLVLDTKAGDITDPAGVEGGMYYNSALGKFRCFQAGAWIDCIDASGGFVSLQNAYDNSTPATIELNATNDGILVRDTAGGIGGDLFAVQNSDGSTTYLGVTTGGINVDGDITASGNATLQNGDLTLQNSGDILATGEIITNVELRILENGPSPTFHGILDVGDLSADQTYTLPDGTGTVCLDTGNCIGGPGGQIGGSGTLNRLAKFTPDGSNVGDSSITDDGVTVTTTSDMVIQGGSLTVGVAGSQLGSLVLAHSNGQTTTLQAGASTGDLTFVLPTGGGNQFQCLKKDTGNQLIWDDCEGGGGGVTTTFQQVYNASNPATFTLNGTNGGLTIRDNATPIGADLLAVQNSDGSDTYVGVTTSAVTLGTDVDLLLQGSNAYISNPQSASGSNSESFGLDAQVTASDQVVIGNAATGAGVRSTVIGRDANSAATPCQEVVLVGYDTQCSNNRGTVVGSGASTLGGIAIGYNAFAHTGEAVAIGNDAQTSSQGTAIGGSAIAGQEAVALGRSANAEHWGIAIGHGADAGQHELVIGGSTASDGYITQGFLGSGVTDASPQDFTLNATGGNGTDIAGANLNIAGGRGTGAADGGNVNIQVSAAGTTGATLNPLATVATFSATEQLRLSHDATNYTSFTVSSDGNITISANGTVGDSIYSTDLLKLGNATDLDPNTSLPATYNYMADSLAGVATGFSSGAGNDSLYIQGRLEVDGGIYPGVGQRDVLFGGLAGFIDGDRDTLSFNESDVCLGIGLDVGPSCTSMLQLTNDPGGGNDNDTVIELQASGTNSPYVMLHTGNNDRWSVGADDNDNQNFKISQGGAAGGFGTNDYLTIDRTDGAATLRNAVDSDSALRVLNAAEQAVFTTDTTNSRVTLGTASALSGQLAFRNTSNANVITIQTAAATADRTITLPDEDGTVCLQGSASCGFVSGSSGDFIQNSTVQQTANMNIVSAASGDVAARIQGAASQSAPVLHVQAGSSPSGQTLVVTNGAGTQIFAVDAQNSRTTVGSTSDCSSGRFCVGQTASTGSGSAFTNIYNSIQGTGRTDAVFIGQDIVFTNTTGSSNNTYRGLRVDMTGVTDTSANFFGLQVLLPSGASTDTAVLQVQNGSTNVFKVGATGRSVYQTTANSSSAFRILNAADIPLFQVDTSNDRVYVGNPTADSTAAVLVLDDKNNSGSNPFGAPNGSMYYNSYTGAFKCYENEAWINCLGSPRPNTRRTTYMAANGTSTWSGVGDSFNSAGGVSSSDGSFSSYPQVRYSTGATVDTVAGIEGTAEYGLGSISRIVYQAGVHLDSSATTSMRIWSGLTDQTRATMGASATPSGNYAAFRRDTSAGDSNYMCVTSDGVSQTVVDSGVSASAGGRRLEVSVLTGNISGGNRAIFKVQDQVVCTITTTLPSTNVAYQVVNSVTNLVSASREIWLEWVYVENTFAND